MGKYIISREEWWPVLSVEDVYKVPGYSNEERAVDVPDWMVRNYRRAVEDLDSFAREIADHLGLDDEFKPRKDEGPVTMSTPPPDDKERT